MNANGQKGKQTDEEERHIPALKPEGRADGGERTYRQTKETAGTGSANTLLTLSLFNLHSHTITDIGTVFIATLFTQPTLKNAWERN